MYGWESKDSDIDYRGCFILNKDCFLGLEKPADVIQISSIENIDIVLFEIKKMIGLALNGNCNILEEINAPQIYKNADFVKLRQLIKEKRTGQPPIKMSIQYFLINGKKDLLLT